MPIRPLKQFGQHFLTDSALADDIVNAAEIQAHEAVWEIGPGKGVLTERLVKQTDKLTAFEIDNRLAELLKEKFSASMQLINRDILACNWQQLLSESISASGNRVKLVSNLPYQITSPVLYKIEENADGFSRIVLMLQKEVAERLTAKAGSKAYGVLTLRVRFRFNVSHLFNVPPTAFDPPPKVHSSVITLTPRTDIPQVKSLDTYGKLIQTAFSHRRKTLRNNLRSFLPAEIISTLEKDAGIDFNRRGETLEEGEFVHLADCLYDLTGNRKLAE